LGKVLNLPRIELYLQHDRPLTESEVSAFRELIRRRVRHEPLQLLLGEVEFFGIKIAVVPGVLIPRPETELLAERVVQELKQQQREQTLRVLDMGTGSGCLAVAVASQVPNAIVDALDIDYEAIRCAEQNAAVRGVQSRVNGILGNVFHENIAVSLHPPYDVLMSNPPYVTEDDYTQLAAEVRDHEPKQALVAAENGLAFYRRLSNLLPILLKPNGFFAFEIGIGQSPEVRALFRELSESLDVQNDYADIPRIVYGRTRTEFPSKIIST
jgi:release factor glutamine methyltransferase